MDIMMINMRKMTITLIFIMTLKVYPNPDEHEDEHQLFVGGSHCVTKALEPPGMSATTFC